MSSCTIACQTSANYIHPRYDIFDTESEHSAPQPDNPLLFNAVAKALLQRSI